MQPVVTTTTEIKTEATSPIPVPSLHPTEPTGSVATKVVSMSTTGDLFRLPDLPLASETPTPTPNQATLGLVRRNPNPPPPMRHVSREEWPFTAAPLPSTPPPSHKFSFIVSSSPSPIYSPSTMHFSLPPVFSPTRLALRLHPPSPTLPPPILRVNSYGNHELVRGSEVEKIGDRGG